MNKLCCYCWQIYDERDKHDCVGALRAQRDKLLAAINLLDQNSYDHHTPYMICIPKDEYKKIMKMVDAKEFDDSENWINVGVISSRRVVSSSQSKRRMVLRWTCSDACHAEHKTLIAAWVHYFWLRIIGYFRK